MGLNLYSFLFEKLIFIILKTLWEFVFLNLLHQVLEIIQSRILVKLQMQNLKNL